MSYFYQVFISQLRPRNWSLQNLYSSIHSSITSKHSHSRNCFFWCGFRASYYRSASYADPQTAAETYFGIKHSHKRSKLQFSDPVLAPVLFNLCNTPFIIFLESFYVQTALLWKLVFASSTRGWVRHWEPPQDPRYLLQDIEIEIKLHWRKYLLPQMNISFSVLLIKHFSLILHM